MSSTYRFLCLSHDPLIPVEGWESQRPDEAVGLAERRGDAEELAAHRGCRLIVGRYSYPLVEAYNPVTRQWADADLLRLLAAARDGGAPAEVFAPYVRRGWDRDTVDRLRPELGLTPVMTAQDVSPAPVRSQA